MKIEKAMRNVLANVHNHYQGKSERILCACSAGLLRSSSCANVLHREYGHNTRAVGLDLEYALIPINHQLIEWADSIVVMESWMKSTKAMFVGNGCVVQVTTQQNNNIAEAVTFVPGVTVIEDIEDGKVVGRHLEVMAI